MSIEQSKRQNIESGQEIPRCDLRIGIVSSSHAAGSTTVGKMLAQVMELPYFSAGAVTRRYSQFVNPADSAGDNSLLKLQTSLNDGLINNFDVRVDGWVLRRVLKKPLIFEGKIVTALAQNGLLPSREGVVKAQYPNLFVVQLHCEAQESAIRALVRDWCTSNAISFSDVPELELVRLRSSFTQEQIAAKSAQLSSRMDSAQKRWVTTYGSLSLEPDLNIDTTHRTPSDVVSTIIMSLIRLGVLPDGERLLSNVLPKYPEDNRVLSEVKAIRDNYHKLLLLALDRLDISPTSVTDISLLGVNDSVNSVCATVSFDLPGDSDDVIVKFSPEPQDENIRALVSWRENGIPTPEILRSFNLHIDGLPDPIYCQTFRVVHDSTRTIAQSGYNYLDHRVLQNDNQSVVDFGQKVGEIMRKMSTLYVSSDVLFGGRELPLASTFASMMQDFIQQNENNFIDLGIPSDSLHRFISQCFQHFSDSSERTYAHNDLAPHNILVQSAQPLELSIIDPNAIVTHPYWDFATAINRFQLIADQLQLEPNVERNIFRYKREAAYFKGLETGWNIVYDTNILFQMKLVRIAQLLWKLAQGFKEGNSRPNDQIVLNVKLRVNVALQLLESLKQ